MAAGIVVLDVVGIAAPGEVDVKGVAAGCAVFACLSRFPCDT